MKFTDPQLQKWYDRNLSEAIDTAEDLRPVRALIATHDVFLTFEGPHSARVHEIIEHLLSAPMLPALRRWYQRAGAETDAVTIEFRDHLSQVAGERLEGTGKNPPPPPRSA